MHGSAATSTYGMARISRSAAIIILQAMRSLTRGTVRAVALARHQPFQPLVSTSTSSRVPVLYSHGCVCVVVRTYHGHGSRVAEFLRLQLVPQTNSNWFAVVLDTDRPERWTTPLRDVVQSANVGDRAIVSNHTVTHYSGNGSYRLTDQAITECPSQCRWLMCTRQSLPPRGALDCRPRVRRRVDGREPDHAEQDGDLAASVITDGWRWKVVRRTLLSHSPNEWECAIQQQYLDRRCRAAPWPMPYGGGANERTPQVSSSAHCSILVV